MRARLPFGWRTVAQKVLPFWDDDGRSRMVGTNDRASSAHGNLKLARTGEAVWRLGRRCRTNPPCCKKAFAIANAPSSGMSFPIPPTTEIFPMLDDDSTAEEEEAIGGAGEDEE